MITLKPFDQSMWDAFAGCESKTPYYAGLGDDLLMIVDDELITLYEEVGVDDYGYTENVFHRTFSNVIEAEQVANALIAVYQVCPGETFRRILCAAISMPEQY